MKSSQKHHDDLSKLWVQKLHIVTTILFYRLLTLNILLDEVQYLAS